jgi:hypothetical protein
MPQACWAVLEPAPDRRSQSSFIHLHWLRLSCAVAGLLLLQTCVQWPRGPCRRCCHCRWLHRFNEGPICCATQGALHVVGTCGWLLPFGVLTAQRRGVVMRTKQLPAVHPSRVRQLCSRRRKLRRAGQHDMFSPCKTNVQVCWLLLSMPAALASHAGVHTQCVVLFSKKV